MQTLTLHPATPTVAPASWFDVIVGACPRSTIARRSTSRNEYRRRIEPERS
ncbi:MAG: hypothetical protein L0H96_02365 [Humibacillus sp.]|nr:hypothetical protein [Humibacillus sp.]MDN5775735.1 hypothetical protein [Humibacillus sp.]